MKNRFEISFDWIRDILKGDGENISSELDVIQSEEALLRYAQAHQVTPAFDLKTKILQNIEKIQHLENNRTNISLENIPLISPESNWLDWAEATQNIFPPAELEQVYMHPLRHDDMVEISVAWVTELIPKEVHSDILESFILLEGTCECYFYDENGIYKTVRMKEGDYISFPINVPHEIHITSSQPAKAILQWLKVAA